MALHQGKAAGRDQVVSYESLASADTEADGEEDPQVRHFQNVTRVVTERVASLISLMGQQVPGAIRREANQDALTQIHNRRYFDRRIARELELCSRDGRPLSIAFLDIDNFGVFNREHGAPTGDAVLRQFVEIVAASIRPVDWLVRYGGEEFCVVMPADVNAALDVAQHVRQRVDAASLRTFGDQIVNITVSIGVAQRQEEASGQAPALLQRASKALQEAKRLGRNRVVVAPGGGPASHVAA